MHMNDPQYELLNVLLADIDVGADVVPDEQQVLAVAESIRAARQLVPIFVTRTSNNRYALIKGRSRYFALLALQATHTFVLVVPGDIRPALFRAVSSLTRKTYTAIDEALLYRELENERFTQSDIARLVGLGQHGRTKVSRTLKLLALPAETIERIKSGALSGSHGYLLTSPELTDAQVDELSAVAVEMQLGVRQLATLVNRIAKGEAAVRPIKSDERHGTLVRTEEIIGQILSSRTILKPKADGSFKLTIDITDADALNELLARLSTIQIPGPDKADEAAQADLQAG